MYCMHVRTYELVSRVRIEDDGWMVMMDRG